MNLIGIFIFCLACSFVFPRPAQAIPPPDFIFQVGSQTAQILSIFVVVGGAVIALTMKWAILFFRKVRQNKVISISIGFVLFAAMMAGAFLTNSLVERRALEGFNREVQASLSGGIEKYDVLSQEDGQAVQTEGEPNSDQVFIMEYYADIGSGDLRSAYEVSKKNVPFEVFEGWYSQISESRVYDISKIGEREYAVEVDLFEDENIVRYAVAMSLIGENELTRVASSQVRVLSSGTTDIFIEGINPGDNLINQKPDLSLPVTNEEFSRADVSKVFVLDAREDEEHEIGRYPGSTHIRFADLLAGAWVNLPVDKEIYVICWSGLRGQEVAEYLRDKGLTARYLEEGASGWVAYGGLWEGGISFSESYSDERYSLTFSIDEVREKINEGALLVDVRDARLKDFRTIPGSVNVSSIFTATEELKDKLTSVPSNSGVITVCDDFLSCFDARIVGIKLEKLGHVFLGRYAAPYEL